MTKKEIAKIIDHTNLKANATPEEIRKTCREAKGCGFRSVCLNPRWVKLAKEELKDTGVRIAVVIDWPVGASSTEARVLPLKLPKKTEPTNSIWLWTLAASRPETTMKF